MTDLALTWSDDLGADLSLAGGALATHDGMRTAILLSLFTDARAPEGMALPEDGDDRRGWWGNAFSGEVSDAAADSDVRNHLGSLLWTLRRAKVLSSVTAQARQFAYEALAWLIRDGVVKTITVEVEAQVQDGLRQLLAIGVILERPEGPARERHDFTWEASA